MTAPLLTVQLRNEHDVVLARQRARQLAEILEFERQDQVGLATAVSEIARNAYDYARQGKVEFALDHDSSTLLITVSDKGPGIPALTEILEGRYASPTGLGIGIAGTRRLMDTFTITSSPQEGTTVVLGKRRPEHSPPLTGKALIGALDKLAQTHPHDPLGEIQRQNQELIAMMEELKRRQGELAQLNRELEDTNRGVVALYAELDEKADYLRRASEIKSRFLSNMTHEFRTPLNSILSLARMLLDRSDGELTLEQEKQVSFIRRAAHDLSELVNDLLDLSKVEAGKIVIRPIDFTIEDLFGALRGMLRPLLAQNSSIALVFDDAASLPALYTDESKVSQILRNFVSNALKYTERGEVRVSARMDGDQTVIISVTDTGIGIRPEDQSLIFEEFTQIESPQQKKTQGTGLGLPLSKKLAELLGGEVSVQSAPGQGSTFSVALPLVFHGAQEIALGAQPVGQVDPSRLPVLIVDDSTETLFIYESYLKGTVFQCIPVRSTRDARNVLRNTKPVAIVLDILLEKENSWDFLAQLKADPATRDIPLFVVTLVQNQAKAMSLGAQDFHLKPVEREWLLQRLRAAVPRKSQPRLLLIDDDEVARYIFRGLATETGCEIFEAAGGHDGLRRAAELLPSVIFLDLSMPDLTGFEVLDRLKNQPATSSIPIIIYTAKTLDETERKRLATQTVAILPKSRGAREVEITSIREAMVLAEKRTRN